MAIAASIFLLTSVVLFVQVLRLRNRLLRHEKLVYIDELTGLPNRKALYDFLAFETARALRNNTKFAVVFIDLDGFKYVNDSLGHHAGDQLLVAVAKKMRAEIREYDILCRFGGDEFVGIFPDIPKVDVMLRIGEKIIAAVNDTPSLGGFAVGASIGVAVYPTDDTNTDELLRKADIAMYRAKGAGKNTICIFDLT